jgi:hypothetical protein
MERSVTSSQIIGESMASYQIIGRNTAGLQATGGSVSKLPMMMMMMRIRRVAIMVLLAFMVQRNAPIRRGAAKI